jgi:hypothetical protein
VYAGIDRLTIQSYSPTLAAMDGVPGNDVDRLAGAGVVSPRILLHRTATPERLAGLSRETGIAEDSLRSLRAAARLVDLKGLGATHYNELRRLGIARVQDLATQDPDVLVPRWRSVANSRPPSLAQVKVWIRAARREPDDT